MTLALWHTASNKSELRPVTDDYSNTDIGDLIRITSLFSLISKGTEKLVASGLVDPQRHAAMSVPYMAGTFSLPIKYGYSLVGITDNKELVHLLHPHQDQAWVARDALYYLPSTVSPQRMTLISNMETIINACWDAEQFCPHWRDKSARVVICGFGAIGSLLAMTLRKLGFTQVFIQEPGEAQQHLAASLGFRVLSACNEVDFALLFHTSGHAAGLQWCIDHAALEGSIMELSWYGTKDCQLSLGGRFHYHRLRIISSQVSQIPGHKPNESYHSRKSLAVKWLQDEVYQALFDEAIPFLDAPTFFHQLRHNLKLSPLQATFSYQQQ